MAMRALAITAILASVVLMSGILGFTIQESTSSLSSNTPDDFSITIKPILSLVLADSDDDDDDARDDDDDDDDACSPDFTCIPGDDDGPCPDGFTCEEECDDGDCELKECELDDANGGDDADNGICAQREGPVCETPPDPLEGNLIIFVNGDGVGFCGIECTVFRGMDFCPGGQTFSTVIFEGTTDENGNLSFDIPEEEFPVVTVVCELAELGGLAGHYYHVDVPTSTPFDFNTVDGMNTCCPI